MNLQDARCNNKDTATVVCLQFRQQPLKYTFCNLVSIIFKIILIFSLLSVLLHIYVICTQKPMFLCTLHTVRFTNVCQKDSFQNVVNRHVSEP